MNILNILNLLTFALPLLLLAAVLIYWLKKGEIKLRWVNTGIFSMLAVFVVTGAYYTIATYGLWASDPFSQYLLPPHTSISYFLRYSFFHFWLNYAIIIMLSLAWAFTLWAINKLSKRNFLDKTDIYLAFLASLAAGWPNFVFLLVIFFGLMLFCQIINIVIFKKNEPLEVAPYLIVGALIALIIGDFLINKLNLGALRI